MTRILSIETSGISCSVALHRDGHAEIWRETTEPNKHGEVLAVYIDEILRESECPVSGLDAIAVSKGPGSYTGLRIGVSLAKAMCYAAGIPLIAVDTLKCLAWSMKQSGEPFPENAVLLPMIDARRMEVYMAAYHMNLELKNSARPVVLEQDFVKDLDPNVKYYAGGSGAWKISEAGLAEVITVVPGISLSAAGMGTLAYEQWSESRFEDIAYFEPVYLKEFARILPGNTGS